ncbi:DUF500-domain-containing protein [Fomitiporia mediterranea MF3/22]|uniref:DUF500-domain-containing protein n=1 Tax=Fomitiporia mediterranea (strain MF3/22) TaxID=694068 RepID=UPI00044085C0|nr:DUF500-domain-containing protein [Fomitiporia mediterranea MF3/22]EJD04279.1 DUF500-domain-containing protein [Fomitiporia mediterranea MF3/22]
MKFNTPLPQPLPKECLKAAKIFKSFVDNGNNGLDGVIPRQVLEHAKGFAIFTIVKAGFLFSARAGSGIVIARLDDGSWSAPSAIGSAGLGVGGQAGAEMTDFLVVLNSRSRSFMSAGSLTLGGNMSIALGPLGRNGEALGSLNTSGKVAAMYSYSKTRGLFGGVSVEGSVIIERQDANALAYRSDVTAKQLLSGAIDPPDWAQPLIKTLEACVGMPGGHKWVDDSFESNTSESGYAFGGGVASPGSEVPPSLRKKKSSTNSSFPPTHWGRRKSGGSFFHANDKEGFDDDFRASTPSKTEETAYGPRSPAVANHAEDQPATASFATKFESDYDTADSTVKDTSFSRPSHRPVQSLGSYSGHASTFKPGSPFNDLPPFPNMNGNDMNVDRPQLTPKRALLAPMSPHEGVGRAIALFDFTAIEPGDLGFRKGQVITITKKTDKTDDWWTGKLDEKEGIFPANFVEVV